jgi:putative oxidoreductase
MDWVLLVGRVLFVALFVRSGLMFHIGQRQAAIGYARAYNAPAPELLVPLTGILIAAAGVLVVLGIWVDLAALVLLVNALAFAYWMHAFWKETDSQVKANQEAHFQKNLGLAGGSLILLYLFQQFGDGIDLIVGPPALFD